jgi:hypothetical protein
VDFRLDFDHLSAEVGQEAERRRARDGACEIEHPQAGEGEPFVSGRKRHGLLLML